jgi:hypothetical protein
MQVDDANPDFGICPHSGVVHVPDLHVGLVQRMANLGSISNISCISCIDIEMAEMPKDWYRRRLSLYLPMTSGDDFFHV